jgi:hypothetical protein
VNLVNLPFLTNDEPYPEPRQDGKARQNENSIN